MPRTLMTSERRLFAVSTFSIAFAWAALLKVIGDTLVYREEARRGAA